MVSRASAQMDELSTTDECGRLLIVFKNRIPGFVWVETLHFFEFVQSIRTEGCLVNHAILTDDECTYSSHTVLRRCGNQPEPSNHDTVHDIIDFSERCGWSLTFEDFEEIAVVRLRLGCVALVNGLGDLLSDGSSPRTIRILPGESILLARNADDSLRVLVY